MNYFTKFAVVLNLPKEALDFAEKLEERMIPVFHGKPVPQDELTDLICEKFSDDGSSDINLMGAALTRINSKKLLIADDAGEGHVSAVCTFIETLLEKFELDDVIGFSWSGTCDKPDPYGFGGGAVAISRHGTEWINTGSWLYTTMEKMTKKFQMAVA